jgi:beta-phosphoglucomutase-like phosphatase (HAD superfamily)
MVDAVLLEWEGVLADTGAARRDSLLRALADEGVLLSAAAYDACCAGADAHGAASAALASVGRSDATLAELVALRAGRSFTERLARGFTLQPGAAEFVAGAAPRARIAIVTRASRGETDVALRLSGLDSAVACVVTADDVLVPPPASELYDRALAHLSRRRTMTRERGEGAVVALAQGSAALRAARAAGARAIAVGAPAHVAVDADAAVSGLSGLTLEMVAALLGLAPATILE